MFLSFPVYWYILTMNWMSYWWFNVFRQNVSGWESEMGKKFETFGEWKLFETLLLKFSKSFLQSYDFPFQPDAYTIKITHSIVSFTSKTSFIYTSPSCTLPVSIESVHTDNSASCGWVSDCSCIGSVFGGTCRWRISANRCCVSSRWCFLHFILRFWNQTFTW